MAACSGVRKEPLGRKFLIWSRDRVALNSHAKEQHKKRLTVRGSFVHLIFNSKTKIENRCQFLIFQFFSSCVFRLTCFIIVLSFSLLITSSETKLTKLTVKTKRFLISRFSLGLLLWRGEHVVTKITQTEDRGKPMLYHTFIKSR